MQKIGIPSTTLSTLAASLTNEELGAAVRLLSHVLGTRSPVAPSRVPVVARVSDAEWQTMRDAVLQHFVARQTGEISHALLEALALPGSAEPAGPVPVASAAIALVDHTRRPTSVPTYGQHQRPEIVSIRKAIFDNGITLFTDSRRSETTARSLVAGLVKTYREGDIGEAISAANRQAELVDPYTWVVAWLRQNATPKSTREPGKGSPVPARKGKEPRPLATPEFLGISPARAEEIRTRNSNLKLDIKRS